MSRTYKVYLQDILEAAERIMSYTEDFPDFTCDQRTLDAVIRNLEVIGEAAKGIPSVVRKKYAQVDWKRMAGLRDMLIHEYFGVDADVLKQIVSGKIPALRTHVANILSQEGGDR